MMDQKLIFVDKLYRAKKLGDYRFRDLVLTGPVPRLDILFRYTHKLSQSGFKSLRASKDFCLLPAQIKK